MIVDGPPYELVVLFADADAVAFVSKVVERGQERGCIRDIRWRAIRDPRRDTAWRSPQQTLGPFLRIPNCRFVILWDHEGSGRERDKPAEVERDVQTSLVAAGVLPESVLAVAFVPELECILHPAWDRVLQLVAEQRRISPPSSAAICTRLAALARVGRSESFDESLRRHPKEVLETALSLLSLRRSVDVYEDLGARLSLPKLKEGEAIRRVANALEAWFPIEPGG